MAMALCLIAVMMAMLAVSACGSTSGTEGTATAEPDTEGTMTAVVTGISAKTTTGDGSIVAYGGTVTVEFPAGNTVQATCSEELAASLEGCPGFWAEEDLAGGSVLMLETSIDSGQEVRVKESETGEWEVVSLAD